jgi:hypothetical protein
MAHVLEAGNAPTHILPSTLRLNSENAGNLGAERVVRLQMTGREAEERQQDQDGEIVIMNTPPAFWTTLPMARPTNASSARSAMARADATDEPMLWVIHATPPRAQRI